MTAIPFHKQVLSLTYNHQLYQGYSELLNLSIKLNQSTREWEKELGYFLSQWIDNSDLIELTTSGSTGQPKTIFIPKIALINSARRTISFFELKPGNTLLLCLSTHYIAGKMMVVRAIIGGCNLISYGVTTNPLANLDNRIDFAAMVPAQASTAYDESIHKFKLIKTIILGGAAVDTNLAEKLNKLSSDFWETYGMTETVSHIAVRRIKQGQNAPFELLDQISIHTDNRSCLIVEPSDINQTALYTNDVIELIDSKHFLLKGRYDHVINSGGIKIFPEEVEAKLSKKIKEPFVISSIPHEKWGEAVVIVTESDNIADIDPLIFKNLHKYQVPKAVYCLSHFPRTANGKLQRNKIKEKLLSFINSPKP